MRYYETLYIMNPDLAEEDHQGVIAKINGLIEAKKGVITNLEPWGKRTLAYPVKKRDRGYYVLVQYCADPGIKAEIERDLKIDDRVLTYQTVKLADEADPEAMLAKARESGSPREGTRETVEATSTAEGQEPTKRDGEV